MKVEYVVRLKEGYEPVLAECYGENDIEYDVKFTIKTRNYANAQRMIRALFKENNIEEMTSCVIED